MKRSSVRRTVWEDPYEPGRNGLFGPEQRIEIHSSLALVILMLGTNDFQSMHANDEWDSAQGMAALIDAIRRAPIELGMLIPEILVVAPPAIQTPKGTLVPKFAGADRVTASSTVDAVHLDAAQHATLGRALVGVVGALLARS